MLRHVVEAVLASRAEPVLVVIGYMSQDVFAALAGLHVRLVDNPDYATGLASSLKAGLRALPVDCDGALILLGDMPRIEASHVDQLIRAYAPETIAVPARDGRIGNPVLWSASYFPELLQLDGDAGAKQLLSVHAAEVRQVDLATDAIFADIDTPEALAKLRGQT